jgi:transposase-like protein
MADIEVTHPAQSLRDVERRFGTEEACKDYLVALRFKDGAFCPRCACVSKVYKLKSRPYHWTCKNCAPNGYRFSILTGTIFENTNIPLKTWFQVVYLMTQSKKGISALQIWRMMDPVRGDRGSYRTAWYMCHRIRAAMADDSGPLGGIVEVDETYIGGSDRNRHKGKKSSDLRAKHQKSEYRKPGESIGYAKVGVIGAIARKGNVVARVIGSLDAPTKQEFVRKLVGKGKFKMLFTDKDHAYRYVDRNLRHEAVDHSKGEYVRGIVHTNTIESFWSLLKRGVMGSFHHVSKDYLPLYLQEFTFRFNQRTNKDIFELVLAGC